MIRILNDEKVINEITVRRIENKIYEVAKLLEKHPEFFSNAKNVNDCRLCSTKFWDQDFIIKLQGKKRILFSKVISDYSEGTIFYNPNKFKFMSVSELVGNITHETCHYFGFTHAFNWNKIRKYETPYFVGYLFQFLGQYYDAFNDNQEEHISQLYLEWREFINKVN